MAEKRFGSGLVNYPIKFRLKLPGVCLFIFWLIMAPLTTRGDLKFFPIEKVRPGLTGYGYTVFKGVKIEKFDVKVLGMVQSGYQPDQLILVKLTGDRLEESGGISAGMSGSPVYIQGKLVGAISYGFENADPFLALITPIKTMVRLLDDREQSADLISFKRKPIPVTTPVIVSGMNRRGYELVKQSLQSYGLTTVFMPSFGLKATGGIQTNLRPGSAVSIQMVMGDYQVSALGTVTLVDDQRFLAFGHSFTNKGYVDYLAFSAFIIRTVKSPVMSFKLGSPVNLIGRITQDRQAGILGKLGEIPDLISVKVSVKDIERNQYCNHIFEVVNHEQIYRDLIISGVTDTIDQTIDRVGGGTAIIDFKILDKDQTLISRQNMFYGKDIAVNCLKELKEVLDLLASNEYSAAQLKSIQVNIAVYNQQTTARIANLNCESTKVKPGDTLTVRAVIHTYRGTDLSIPFTIQLPKNLEPGKLTLVAQSGAKDLPDESNDSPKNETKNEYQNIGSLSALLTKFSDSPKNNELVIEYYPANSKKPDASNPVKENEFKPVKLRTHTEYFLSGEAQLSLDVVQL
jgi:hypothetical protein